MFFLNFKIKNNVITDNYLNIMEMKTQASNELMTMIICLSIGILFVLFFFI